MTGSVAMAESATAPSQRGLLRGSLGVSLLLRLLLMGSSFTLFLVLFLEFLSHLHAFAVSHELADLPLLEACPALPLQSVRCSIAASKCCLSSVKGQVLRIQPQYPYAAHADHFLA